MSVQIECTNHGHLVQNVDIALFEPSQAKRAFTGERNTEDAIALDLFVDEQRKAPLASAPQEPNAVRRSIQLQPKGSGRMELPLFASLQLSRLIPAGVYRQPVQLKLRYDYRGAPEPVTQ